MFSVALSRGVVVGTVFRFVVVSSTSDPSSDSSIGITSLPATSSFSSALMPSTMSTIAPPSSQPFEGPAKSPFDRRRLALQDFRQGTSVNDTNGEAAGPSANLLCRQERKGLKKLRKRLSRSCDSSLDPDFLNEACMSHSGEFEEHPERDYYLVCDDAPVPMLRKMWRAKNRDNQIRARSAPPSTTNLFSIPEKKKLFSVPRVADGFQRLKGVRFSGNEVRAIPGRGESPPTNELFDDHELSSAPGPTEEPSRTAWLDESDSSRLVLAGARTPTRTTAAVPAPVVLGNSRQTQHDDSPQQMSAEDFFDFPHHTRIEVLSRDEDLLGDNVILRPARTEAATISSSTHGVVGAHQAGPAVVLPHQAVLPHQPLPVSADVGTC